MDQQGFYYSDGPFLHVMQNLYHGLTNKEAFLQLMGTAGSGKSLLLRKFTQYMQRKGHQVIYIDEPIESPELLRSLLADKFNLPSSNNFSRLLEDALAVAEQRNYILIFDDAHLLSDISLIEIQRLSEIQVDSERVLNIVLCGEPDLDLRFQSKTEFKSLLLNVSQKLMLQPMSPVEQDDLIRTYLLTSQFSDLELTEEAKELIHGTCRGYPEPLVAIAELIVAQCPQDTIELGKAELSGWIKATELRASLPSEQLLDRDQFKILAPIAAVFVLAAFGFVVQWMSSDENASINVPLAEVSDPPAPEVDSSPFVEPTERLSEAESEANELVAAIEEEVTARPNSEPQEIPSLLRPAPVFSLDEEEEPVSDSSLALVTAAEIGIARAQITEPEYEDYVDPVSVVLTETAPGAQEQDRPVQEQSDALVSQEVTDIVEEVSLVAVDDQELPTAEEDADIPSLSESEVFEIASEVSSDSVSNSDPSLELSKEPAQPLVAARERVDTWVAAWQSQELEEYFASYHENFEPRYESTFDRWQRSRTRVIGNAEWIRLSMTEYDVVEESSTEIEIHFWLDYESPTYSDSTRKKLVLQRSGERWLILEEINLQVRS